MTNTIANVNAATTVWKIVSSRPGNPEATLATTPTPSKATITTATSGRDALRPARAASGCRLGLR